MSSICKNLDIHPESNARRSMAEAALFTMSLFFATMFFSILPLQAAQKKDSRTEIERGKEIFEKTTCVHCHAGGENFVRPSKPIKGAEFQKKYPDDKQIVALIRKGVFGSSMPGFGTDVISEEQMKDLVVYIRSLSVEEKSVNSPPASSWQKKK